MRLLQTLTRVLVVLVGITLIIGAFALSDQYRDRIYPGVSIDDPTGAGLITGPLDVGGLTRRAAGDRLTARLASPDSLGVTLQVGKESWKITWAMVGQAWNVQDAVDRAFAVGRSARAANGLVAWFHQGACTSVDDDPGIDDPRRCSAGACAR